VGKEVTKWLTKVMHLVKLGAMNPISIRIQRMPKTLTQLIKRYNIYP